MARPAGLLTATKAQAHNALAMAIEASPDLASTFQRWWVEAQQTAERKPTSVKVIVFHRTALLLELMADRAGWPAGRIA